MAEAIDLDRLIDDSPISRRQKLVFLLCCALAAVEGFDMQVIALVAPAMAEQWGIEKIAFGLVFTAGLFASMTGGFLVSALGGRVAPKVAMECSVVLFAVATLLTARVTGIAQLAALRFVAGLGLGAAVPGLIAIVAGYTTSRLRSPAVTVAAASQVLGAVIGGAMVARMVPALGWQSAFVLGGIAPLLLLAIAHPIVPESAHWLLLRHGDNAAVAHILRSMGMAAQTGATYLVATTRATSAISISSLLAPGFRRGTIAFWGICLAGSVFFSLLVSWLPTVIRDSGATLSRAIFTSVVLNAGGFLGALTISWLMAWRSPYRLVALGYVVGGVLTAAVGGLGLLSPATALFAMFAIGLTGFGAYFCMTALQTYYFPGHLVNVAIGCSKGFARAGGIAGPLIGTAILAYGGQVRAMFLAAAAFALAAALAALFMGAAAARRAVTDA